MIIFGLGNPLAKYKDTRHNIGFMVVDKLAKKLSLRFVRYSSYHIARSKDNLVFIKPMLYMNNSGIAVSKYLDARGMLDFFIVVYDDLALPLGKIRIRGKGSDGGHQGLASIIYHLNTTEFPRLRIGISAPPSDVIATDYVLTKFSDDEKPTLNRVLEHVCDALQMINKNGIKTAMNKFNPLEVSTDVEISK